jgi:hypothetical protein
MMPFTGLSLFFCLPNEKALLGGRDLDLDVVVHPKALSEGFRDGDLTSLGYPHK